eukprot:scaffold4967_cov116-Isochrysis_galbana.AAC.11
MAMGRWGFCCTAPAERRRCSQCREGTSVIIKNVVFMKIRSLRWRNCRTIWAELGRQVNEEMRPLCAARRIRGDTSVGKTPGSRCNHSSFCFSVPAEDCRCSQSRRRANSRLGQNGVNISHAPLSGSKASR